MIMVTARTALVVRLLYEERWEVEDSMMCVDNRSLGVYHLSHAHQQWYALYMEQRRWAKG